MAKASQDIVRVMAFTLGEWNWEATAGLTYESFIQAIMLENRL